MQRSHELRTALRLAIGLALVLQAAPGQHAPVGGGGGGTTGGGVGGGNTGNIRTTTPTPDPTQPRTQQPSIGDLQNRPIFLSGKVQMDDGSVPPEPVVIERVCGGAARGEGYTDSKGRFSFQLGQNNGVLQDASYSSVGDTGIGNTMGDTMGNKGTPGGPTGSRNSVGAPRPATSAEQNLQGCELRASLPGYRSELVNLSGRRMFDHPDVGTIILRRLAGVEGTTISVTTLQAPKDAKRAFDKGREAVQKGKIADAQKNFEKAVDVYPQFAAAWYELGRIHENQNEISEARKCYSQALSADAKFLSPYLRLALLSAGDKNWKDVADLTNRVTRLNSFDFPEAFYYNSVANYNLGKLDDAEASARRAQQLDTGNRMPKVNHVLGAILYTKRDYAGAAEQMRNYLKFAPDAADTRQVKMQLTEIEKLSGETKAKADKPQEQ